VLLLFRLSLQGFGFGCSGEMVVVGVLGLIWNIEDGFRKNKS
jgi:hypothetical protein